MSSSLTAKPKEIIVRVLIAFCAALLVASLTGCGSSGGGSNTSQPPPVVTAGTYAGGSRTGHTPDPATSYALQLPNTDQQTPLPSVVLTDPPVAGGYPTLTVTLPYTTINAQISALGSFTGAAVPGTVPYDDAWQETSDGLYFWNLSWLAPLGRYMLDVRTNATPSVVVNEWMLVSGAGQSETWTTGQYGGGHNGGVYSTYTYQLPAPTTISQLNIYDSVDPGVLPPEFTVVLPFTIIDDYLINGVVCLDRTVPGTVAEDAGWTLTSDGQYYWELVADPSSGLFILMVRTNATPSVIIGQWGMVGGPAS
jgi:hypothetical protein